MSFRSVLSRIEIIIPFGLLALSQWLSYSTLFSDIMQFSSLFIILYVLHVPTLLFKDKQKKSNLLFSFASLFSLMVFYFYSWSFPLRFTMTTLSVLLLLLSGYFIWRHFSTLSFSSPIGTLIHRALKSVKKLSEKKFGTYCLISIFLILALLGSLIMFLFILAISMFYLYVFLFLVGWKFINLILKHGLRHHKFEDDFHSAVQSAFHLESDFLRNFLKQLLSPRGILYSFLFIFSAVFIAIGSIVGVLGPLSLIEQSAEMIPRFSGLSFSSMLNILLGIGVIFYLASLVLINVYPFYFITSLITLNTKRQTNKNHQMKIMPYPLLSVFMFFLYFPVSYATSIGFPLIAQIKLFVVPIINFCFFIILIVTKQKKGVYLRKN